MKVTILSENIICRKKNPRKTPNKYLNLRVLDQNEAFLPGVIYSVFDTSEDKPVRE